jgi:hypothetical protein
MKQASVLIPKKYSEKYNLRMVYMRPFGAGAEDLNIDFDMTAPPRLVTRILSACLFGQNGKSISEELLWELTVNTRLGLLLKVMFLSCTGGIWIPLVCKNPECRQKIEIELEQADLEEELTPADQENISVKTGNKEISLHHPLGSHQLQWLAREYQDEKAACNLIIQTLIETTVTEVDLRQITGSKQAVQAIDLALRKFDPLTAFSMSIVCPCCKKEAEYEIELQALALRELAVLQRNMVYKVHILAKHYHWTEDTILSLPEWRREAYLKLLLGGSKEDVLVPF